VARAKSLVGDDVLNLYHMLITDDEAMADLSADNLHMAVEGEGERNINDDRSCGILQLMALSTLLKEGIVSVYPDEPPFEYRELFHSTIHPLGHDTRQIFVQPRVVRPLIFFWTQSYGANESVFFFKHVIPIFEFSRKRESSKCLTETVKVKKFKSLQPSKSVALPTVQSSKDIGKQSQTITPENDKESSSADIDKHLIVSPKPKSTVKKVKEEELEYESDVSMRDENYMTVMYLVTCIHIKHYICNTGLECFIRHYLSKVLNLPRLN